MKPPYPRFVAKKLTALSDLADEYTAATQVPYGRAERLRVQLAELRMTLASHKSMVGSDPGNIAAINAEIRETQNEIDTLIKTTNDRSAIAASQKQCYLQAIDWLNKLPDNTKLVESKAILIETTNLRGALADARRSIDALQAAIRKIFPEGNALTLEGRLKMKVIKAAYTVKAEVKDDTIELQWTRPGSRPTSKPDDLFAMLASLFPDQMTRLLVAGADLGARKREVDAEISRLTAEMVERERFEEAIIMATAATGQPIERRILRFAASASGMRD